MTSSPGGDDTSELQEVNARLLIAGLQAQEQTDIQVVLNTALRELMETREHAAQERELLLAREQDARNQAEALSAENARLLIVAQAARDQAEAALSVRETFLAIASHELRSPVTYVKSLAQFALRRLGRGSLDKEKAEEQFKSIIEAADRLEALISDLLDVSRMRSGGPTIRTAELDVAALVDGAARRSAEGIGARHRVLVEVHDRPAMLGVDGGRLEQVLDNLLGNAVKYSMPGTEIRVRLRWADDDLVLTIVDEGIGLPAGEHERIFEPFGRASNVGDGRLPGLGLGLYICRQIVEAHGGRIWAESPGPGRGTIIFVVLPRQPSKNAD